MGTAIGPRSRQTCQIFHFPFSPRGGFLCGNGAPLFFTYFDYVVLLSVGSANLGHRCLHTSRPMDFNKRRETSSIASWRISRSWIVLPHIFLNNWTSSGKPVWATSSSSNQPRETRIATSAYNPGKYGNSPVGCRPKEGQVVQKIQASRGVVFFLFPGPLWIFATCLAFGA
jgi:hypothetical protein